MWAYFVFTIYSRRQAIEVKQLGYLSLSLSLSLLEHYHYLAGWIAEYIISAHLLQCLKTGFSQLCFRPGRAEGVQRCSNRNIPGEEFLCVFISRPADTNDICLSPGRQPMGGINLASGPR